jgi:ABC-2 type transport system permease protein
MRAILFTGKFDHRLFFGALALNALYLAIGAAIYFYAFHRARYRGALLQIGE